MMSLSQMLAAKAGGPSAVQPGKPAGPGVTVNPYGPKGPTGLPGPVVTPPAPAPGPRRPGALAMPMGGMGGGYGATYQAMGGPGGGYAQPLGAPPSPQPFFGRNFAR